MADNTKPTVIIDNHAQGAGEDTPAPEERRKAWVRYRTEYRHPINGEVIHKKDTDGLYTESYEDNDSQWPAFEIITTYKVRMTSVTGAGINNTEAIPISTSLSTPSYHMNIYSVAIINALQSVVKYYPLQNLTGDSVVVKWPFPVLVHHYKELIAFRDTCASTNPDILCVKEKGAQEHIDLLMCFLDEHIMPAVHAEEARNARGFETWESLWVKYKPGSTTLAKPVLDKEYNANVVHSLSGGTFMNPPEPWCLTLWSLKFDGTLLNRFKSTVIQDKFDGECASHAKTIAVEDQDFNQDSVASFGEILSRRYELGKRYWQLLEKQCQHYKGKVGDFPYNEVSF